MRRRLTTLWTTSFLRALLLRRPPSRLVLTFFTKSGCSLCETGRGVVEPVARATGAEVNAINIGDDPVLLERWGTRVPVVTAEGTVLVEGRFDGRELRRALAAYGRHAGSR